MKFLLGPVCALLANKSKPGHNNSHTSIHPSLEGGKWRNQLSTSAFKFVPENPLPWFVNGGAHLPCQAPSAVVSNIRASNIIPSSSFELGISSYHQHLSCRYHPIIGATDIIIPSSYRRCQYYPTIRATDSILSSELGKPSLKKYWYC